MPRPGLRLRGRVPKPPWWPPSPDRGAIGQTHRRGRGDSTPGGRDRRGAEAGPLGAPGAGSLRPGAGLEPRTCAQAQPSRKSRVAGGWSRGCHPLPEDDAEAAGSRALWCAAGKEGRSRPRRWAVLLHRLATPLPGCGRVSALAPPPGGVSRTPDLSASCPGSPTPSSAAQRPGPLAAVPASPRTPEARPTPPGLCSVRSVVPLTHIRAESHRPPFREPSLRNRPWRPQPCSPLCPAQIPRVWVVCVWLWPPWHPTWIQSRTRQVAESVLVLPP